MSGYLFINVWILFGMPGYLFVCVDTIKYAWIFFCMGGYHSVCLEIFLYMCGYHSVHLDNLLDVYVFPSSK